MIQLTAEERQMERDDSEDAQLVDAVQWRKRHDLRIDAVERAVLDNTRITSEIKANTDDIVEFFQAGQGTFKVLKMIGTIAKWITTVAAAITVSYLMWRGGSKP